MDLYTEHAIELLDIPPEWESYKWEVLGDTQKSKVYAITGAIAPLKTKGKNKGQRNWAKLDPKTKQTAYITPDKHKKWIMEWENKTGKCSKCVGTSKKN